MQKSVTIIVALLALAASARANDYRKPEYQGTVYYEISIDDRGILLTDSLGEVTEIPLASAGEADGGGAGTSSLDDELIDEFSDCQQIHDEIMRMGGSTVIDEDECVVGNVVVFGDVSVRGKVGGSVTATGKVRIYRSAVIRGDVIGRAVIVDQGADVWGDVRENDYSSIVDQGWQLEQGSSGALVMLVLILLQMGVVAFVSSVFRTPTDRVKQVMHENIFKALLVGFLVLILLIPALILLLITVIGIPVAILGLPLALVGGGFLGLAAFCLFVSDLVGGSREGQTEGRLTRTVTGFLILQSPFIALFLFELVNISVLSIIFLIISSLVFVIVFTTSLGAVTLTRFGTRTHTDRGAKAVHVSVKVGGDSQRA
ncbi:MAG: polymer-forming cytoskeletal protein [bacterium]